MLRTTPLSCVLAGLVLTALTACNTDANPTNPELSTQDACSRTVTINDVSESVPANTTHHGANFNVHNNNGTSNTATVVCTTAGNLTCSGGNPSVTLAPGETKIVTLLFDAGAPRLKNKITATSCGGSATALVQVI